MEKHLRDSSTPEAKAGNKKNRFGKLGEKAAAFAALAGILAQTVSPAFAKAPKEEKVQPDNAQVRKISPEEMEANGKNVTEAEAETPEIQTTNHIVTKGESVSRIAENYLTRDLKRKPTKQERVEMKTMICEMNNLSNPDSIQEGKTLVIPRFTGKTEVKPVENVSPNTEAEVGVEKQIAVEEVSAERFPVKKGEKGINDVLQRLYGEEGLFKRFYQLTPAEKDLREAFIKANQLTNYTSDLGDLFVIPSEAKALEEKAALEVCEVRFARYIGINTGEKPSKLDKVIIGSFREATRGMSPTKIQEFSDTLEKRFKAKTSIFSSKESIVREIENAAIEFRFWESATGKAVRAEVKDNADKGVAVKKFFDKRMEAWLKTPTKNLPAGVRLYVDALNTVAKPEILKQEIKKLREKLKEDKNPKHEAQQKKLEELQQQLAAAEKAAEDVNPTAILEKGIAAELKSLRGKNLDAKTYLKKLSVYFQIFDQFPIDQNNLEAIKKSVATPEIKAALIDIAKNNAGKGFNLQSALLANDAFKLLPETMQHEIAEALGEKNPYSTEGKLVNEAQAIWGKYLPSLAALDFTAFSRQSGEWGIFLGYLKQAFEKTAYLKKEERPKAVGELALITGEMKNEATYKEALEKLEALLREIAKLEGKNWENTWVESHGGNIGEGGKGEIGMGIRLPNQNAEGNIRANQEGGTVEVKKDKWMGSAGWNTFTGPDASVMYQFVEKKWDEGKESFKAFFGPSLKGFIDAVNPVKFGMEFVRKLFTGKFELSLPFARFELTDKDGGLLNQQTPAVTDPTKLNASFERLQEEETGGGFSATVVENMITSGDSGVGFALIDGNQAEISLHATKNFDKNHALKIDFSAIPADERVAIITTLGKYIPLPEGFQNNGMEGVTLAVSLGGEHEGKYNHERFLDLLAGGLAATLHFADGSQLKLSASAFDLDKTNWKSNGDGTESRLTGGKATEIAAELRKVLGESGITGIVGITFANYKSDGHSREETVVVKFGAEYEGFEVTAGTNGAVVVSYKLPDGTKFFGMFDENGRFVIGFRQEFASLEETRKGIASLCYPLEDGNTPIDVTSVKETGAKLDMNKATAFGIEKMREAKGKLGESETRAEAPATNNTLDNLNVDVANNGGNTINAADAAAAATSTISDTLADGINNTDKTALSSIATYKAEYKVGVGAWTPLTITGLGYNNGVLSFTTDTRGGPAAGDLFRITLTTAVGNLPAGTVIVGTNF